MTFILPRNISTPDDDGGDDDRMIAILTHAGPSTADDGKIIQRSTFYTENRERKNIFVILLLEYGTDATAVALACMENF